jgi:hypothetical protein
MLKFDGFHKALMGSAEVWVPTGVGMSLVKKAVYDGYRMVRVLMRKGMTEEEAREYISFNVEGAYLGPETPIIYWQHVEH